ncbi:hypothetical protein [Pseudomonas fluorescens]|uniref:hypothetical protein n=1 Tax=Pseudomonas fluorescens TaxID=294 RepID=UPI001C459DEC|nr:hypothetical protein [Pseudomonas fluorescens]QXN48207.1 hypothetical protein KW062_18105 [Pseudomonas fluorescens]WSO22516.1 hypothetical protein VUJ50_18225 [Pseudomonas fluorescens]
MDVTGSRHRLQFALKARSVASTSAVHHSEFRAHTAINVLLDEEHIEYHQAQEGFGFGF